MIKTFHIALAYASVAGFVIRLGWSYVAPDLLSEKWVRVTPHVVDTLLLILGVTLAFSLIRRPLAGLARRQAGGSGGLYSVRRDGAAG